MGASLKVALAALRSFWLATNALLVSIRSQQIGPLQRKPLPSCEVENVAAKLAGHRASPPNVESETLTPS